MPGTDLFMTSTADWQTTTGCCPDMMAPYTVCQSENDYNLIAEHLGLEERTGCLTIYCLRLNANFGGACKLFNMAMQLRVKYEEKYSLNHQEPEGCCVRTYGGEFLWKQIKKEHLKRFGAEMTTKAPASSEMVRA